jgi:beta-glucanase (GH16 family)
MTLKIKPSVWQAEKPHQGICESAGAKRDGRRSGTIKRYFARGIGLFLFPALAFAANPAVRLAFSPSTLTASETSCASSTVLTKNTIGQQTPLTSNKTMDINGPASLSFYADSACTQKSFRFAFVSGTSSYTFYVRGTTAGMFSIRAQAPGLESATQQVSVASLPSTVSTDGFQNPPTRAPQQASAAGYNTLVFGDEFNSAATISPDGSGSYNWYTTNFYSHSATLPTSGYKVSNGYLTILTDASGYSAGIATADPTNSSGVWQHGYFEARIRFNPAGNRGSAWPAFWSYSIEGASGLVPIGSYFSELDFMECYPTGSACTYITTVHQWQNTDSGDTSVAQNSNNDPAVPAGTDFRQWHIYGCLWTPSQVQWYLDNKLVTTVPTGPGTSFTALEQDHMFLVLGAGKNWPMDVDYVHVWQ